MVGEVLETGPNENDFSEAMKDVPDFDAREDLLVEPNGMFANSRASAYNTTPEQFRTIVTPESVSEYDKSQVARNFMKLNMLGQPFLAGAYKNVVREFPELNNVRLYDNSALENNAYFSQINKREDGGFEPSVTMNFSNLETYLGPEQINEGDNFGMDHTLNLLAIKTGARPSEIMRNKRLLSTFVMMHELGHALDFKMNYLQPAEEQGLPKSEALIAAMVQNNHDRIGEMMSEPIPGQIEGRLDYTAYAFRERLGAMGINPRDLNEVMLAEKIGYREMRSESFADEFATDYIMRHYDDFFEAPDKERISKNKVRTHIGETICVSPSMDCLGLNGGVGVQFSLAHVVPDPEMGGFKLQGDADDRPFKVFLNRAVKIGEPMSVNLDGDAVSGRCDVSPVVMNSYVRYYRDENGKVQHETFIQTRNPNVSDEQLKNMTPMEQLRRSVIFKVEKTNEEPAEIECPVGEMTERFGIGVGSKIILMKKGVDTLTGRPSYNNVGEMLGGMVTQPIQIGKQITLEDTAYEGNFQLGTIDPGFMTGGNTSRVIDVYRKWKSYYVRTENSVFEVIPYQ